MNAFHRREADGDSFIFDWDRQDLQLATVALQRFTQLQQTMSLQLVDFLTGQSIKF